MSKIRLGVIGCGGMMKAHITGFSEIADKLEVTAVCDIDLTRAKDAASGLNDPFITADYKEMVPYVDAVLVVLPHDLHYECGMFFARNKKHILMEKPLCNTEEECLRLIDACEEEKVVLMCAYPVRFWPGIIRLKEIIDNKEYGEMFHMSIWTEQMTKYPETHWCSTGRLGGGQFFSHGCHYVDILLWFMGEPEKGFHLGTNYGTPWMLKEGTSDIAIKFKSGAVGYHFGTWGARGTKMAYDFQIHCTEGTLEYEHFSSEIRLHKYKNSSDLGTGENETTVIWKYEKGASKHTQFEMLHFLDCIENGKTPDTNGHSALQGLRLVWALYEAEKNDVIADLTGLGIEK